MIQKVTKNYAGFTFKVNASTGKKYAKLVDSLRKEAIVVRNPGNCYKILYSYRSFFDDHHLIINTTIPNNGEAMPEKSEIQSHWTTKSLLNYLKEKRKELTPIEGIWKSPGYRIGVVYNAGRGNYEAIVLESGNPNWKQGMIKFKATPSWPQHYKSEYYTGGLEKRDLIIRVFKNYLEVLDFGAWKKEFPVSADTISQQSFEENYSEFGNFQFKYLNDSTVYIRIRSCELSYKHLVDSILSCNKEKLKAITAWMLDLRGNTGGSVFVFDSITPYLYTRPYISKDGRFWMSEENIALTKKWNEDNERYLDSSTNKSNKQEIEYWEKHPNTWTENKLDSIVVLDTVLHYPKRVAILSDKKNTSAGEYYLIWAKGFSDKVKIFGENSAGFLDFGDFKINPLPCDKYVLYIPTSTTDHIEKGISYDASGYPPDIYIPAKNRDWIKFVLDYWSKL